MHHAILTLDHGGRPARWATWQQAVLLKSKGLIAWHLGDDFEFHGGVSRASGERTIVRVPSIIAIKNQVFEGKIHFCNRTLFVRDHFTCCYCGQRFSGADLTREHIIPISRGGRDNWQNCAACCRQCNHRKNDRLPEECGMSLVYLPYTPSPVEALVLTGRHIKADQMAFLAGCLPEHSRVLSVPASAIAA